MSIRFRPNIILLASFWLSLVIGTPVLTMPQTCTEIDLAQIPLEALAPSPAPANVVFLLDDSTSMDDEILVADPGSALLRRYLFDNAGDNASDAPGDYFDPTERKLWRYQWQGYNRLYYNPAVRYDPWPNMVQADDQTPRSNPILADRTQDLDAPYALVGSQIEVDDGDDGAITIPVAHYYLRTDAGTPYLVMLDGGLRYYRIDDQAKGQTGHGMVEFDELVEVTGLPAEIDPCLTYEQDRQNFANWFSYHRKRSLAVTSAVANTIAGYEKHPPNSCAGASGEPEPIGGLKDVAVGLLTLNSTLQQPVLPVKIETGDDTQDETEALLAKLYTYAMNIDVGQQTLLRAGLDCVGRYYSTDLACTDLGNAPMAAEAAGGACQKQFVVIVTDGAYNGTAPGGIGNQDGDQGSPYADGHSDTLADVAMKYYKNDLSGDHEGIQKMHTFAVGFGVEGTLDRDHYPEAWPEPTDDASKIDDLWHATVNGRGAYYQSDSPDEMVKGLQAIKDTLLAFSGASAPVSATGEAVASENTVFVPGYESEFWTGDLKAYTLSDRGATRLKWSAANQLEGVSADDRNIYTYNGTSGVEFLFGPVPPGTLNEDEINYLRGDPSNEQQNGGLFRDRVSILGDIVHSAPTYSDDAIFVGANDGMLHAFAASDGRELFAYIPNLVFNNLSKLTDALYGDTVSHHFYVDLTPTVGMVNSATYLIGGLGGGGKGYFALDVTRPSAFNADDVLWEFPATGTSQDHIDDMGFSFSRVMIVKTRAGTKALFGNGYYSTNGHAVLFVLDPTTGDVDAKIDTGAGGNDCNGLSTPVVIDVDNDEIADYAYAGDLKGNLWRFDLTDSSPGNWKQEKLFQAKRSNGDAQPITTQPDAMFHCTGAENGVLVTFGTGRYLSETDLDPDGYITETLYGIWDLDGKWNGAVSAHNWGTVNHGTGALSGTRSGFSDELLEQEVLATVTEGEKTYRVVSGHPVYWKLSVDSTLPVSHGGYFLDLPESGERMITDTSIRDFRLIAVSLKPSIEPCSSGGDSYLHLLNACSGGRDPLLQIDVNGDNEITSTDRVASGSGDVPASAIQIQGVMQQPLVLRNLNDDGAQTERLVFPQAFTGGDGVDAGSTGVVTVRPERRGIYYWREVR